MRVIFILLALVACGTSEAATLRERIDAAIRLRGSANVPVEVRLETGDYELGEPLRLGPADSGLVLTCAKGARLTRSVACRPGARLTGDFPPLPVAECHRSPEAHAPLIFYDHRWAVEARWPNAGWATFTNIVCAGDKTTPGAFVFASERPLKWDFDEGAWVCGYFSHDWAYERIRAASFCASNGVLRLAAPTTFGLGGSSWCAGSARRFFVSGVRSELDEPGEYYFDRRTKTVEFLAPDGMREFRAATKPGPVIEIDGATNVVLRGLDIEYAVGDGVTVRNSRDVLLDRCRISNVGGSGVTIAGGARCRVRECAIEGTGLHAVNVSGGDRKRLLPGEHVVERSALSRYGKIRHTYVVGVLLNGCGNRVICNRIFDAPHTAVLYSGNDHLMADNEVWNVLYECFDAGAFYTGRDPTSRGNVLRGNYVHDVGRRGNGSGTMAFYLDDCDAGDTLISNRVVNVARGLMIGGGQDNHIIGNSFTDCDIGLSLDDRGLGWAMEFWDNPGHVSWQMTRKVKEMSVGDEPWRSRYPLLVDYLKVAPREPRHVSIVGNVFTRCDEAIVLPKKTDAYRRYLNIRDNAIQP